MTKEDPSTSEARQDSDTVDALREMLEAPDITQPGVWWPMGADHPEYREGAMWIERWWRARLTSIIAASEREDGQ